MGTEFNAGFQPVRIKSQELIFLPGIDIKPGGLEQGDSVAHLQIVDLAQGRVWLVPLNTEALNSIIGQATHIHDAVTTGTPDTEEENAG